MQLKHLLITVISLISLSASAQINKGSIFLGGHLGFWTGKEQTQKSVSFNVTPAVGIAVSENLVAGLDLTFDHAKTEYTPVFGTTRTRHVGGGVFLRKYATLGKGFYLFGQGRVGAVRSTSDYATSNFGQDSKGFSLNLGVYPGVAYNVNRKLQLEIGFPNVFNVAWSNMNYDATPNNTAYKTSHFSATTSLSSSTNFLSLGVRVFLEKARS